MVLCSTIYNVLVLLLPGVVLGDVFKAALLIRSRKYMKKLDITMLILTKCFLFFIFYRMTGSVASAKRSYHPSVYIPDTRYVYNYVSSESNFNVNITHCMGNVIFYMYRGIWSTWYIQNIYISIYILDIISHVIIYIYIYTIYKGFFFHNDIVNKYVMGGTMCVLCSV